MDEIIREDVMGHRCRLEVRTIRGSLATNFDVPAHLYILPIRYYNKPMAGGKDVVDGGFVGESESIPEDHDVDSLYTAQDEARAVLDHQIQMFSNVDDKAAKTFRLDAILLGLTLTAASFASQSAILDLTLYINPLTIVAVIALIVSFIFAVVTFTGTEISTGLAPTGINRLLENRYTETEWLILLLRSEGEWMRANEARQSRNATYLFISHGTLILAVVAAFLGIVYPHAQVWISGVL